MNIQIKENIKVKKLKASHRTIYTDIEIEASPEEVWEVLTDTDSYKKWAVFMVDVQGEIKDGNRITVIFQINPEKEKRNIIDHTISVIDNEEFFWAEKGPGGISDNHHFKVESVGNSKTRFIQSDELKGGITWLMGGNLSKMYGEGYQAFNRNLKTEVERRFKK
ncbi:SRPBCC domain-containing protein [Winogradskyella sp.]|uniref:SRPBCC domain-containing protein n=1 Tax=Winogradskyella sp. TaxID=1883156 RepID=UPI0026059E31|nr:SRPBCC domain-containing protein [Winogradskyella sp.]